MPQHLSLTGLTSRVPMMRELVYSNLSGKLACSGLTLTLSVECVLCLSDVEYPASRRGYLTLSFRYSAGSGM